MKYRTKILIALFTVTAIAVPFVVFAESQLLPSCVEDGRCHLNDIVQTFINLSRLLLGFVGSAVLVFFIYGGFVWLTSGGSADKIKKGKDIVVNSIIGLIIVFGAFMIVQFVTESLGAQEETRVGQPCVDTSGNAGVYIGNSDDPGGALQCVTDCSGIPESSSYSCQPVSGGTNCIPGLCPTHPPNVMCCQ
jgi:hypothetical protein